MRYAWVCLAVCVVGFGVHSRIAASAAENAPPIPVLQGRLIASGIPGAGAVAQVGTFHAGSPIHDLPAFAAYTVIGKILDPKRVMVASSSNFGAPRIDGMPAGALLSIDPNDDGRALTIAEAIVAHDGEATSAVTKYRALDAASKRTLIYFVDRL